MATVTGSMTILVLGAGLIAAHLMRRRSDAISNFFLKSRRKLILSIQELEKKTTKTKFEKALLYTEKFISKSIRVITNAPTNFDHASKSYLDEKLMNIPNNKKISL